MYTCKIIQFKEMFHQVTMLIDYNPQSTHLSGDEMNAIFVITDSLYSIPLFLTCLQDSITDSETPTYCEHDACL